MENHLAETPVIKEYGSYPVEIVLYKWSENKFVTHMELLDDEGNHKAYEHGEYFENKNDALASFYERAHYRFGNAVKSGAEIS